MCSKKIILILLIAFFSIASVSLAQSTDKLNCGHDNDGDGIYSDGDCSGVEGDNPCGDGESVNCDDNCPDTYNDDQCDYYGTGVGNRCEVSCCVTPGDANGNGNVNILDITFLVAYLYQSGPEPPCLDEADTNGSCSINIIDITDLIRYLYMVWDPVCGCVVREMECTE